MSWKNGDGKVGANVGGTMESGISSVVEVTAVIGRDKRRRRKREGMKEDRTGP